MSEIKITPTEKGLNIEARNEKFDLSYDEALLPWRDGRKWCEKNGGTLPSLAQLAILYEFFEEINTSLRDQGGTELSRTFYWSSSESYSSYAWYVSFGSGGMYGNGKFGAGRVRAVAAFQ
ncbi:hypothetical protein [Alistipes putredinis]|uniref:hypothetical protein n=1 Tax=Alistipes putredinis TaxID=28117 RepID=UPI003AB179DB